MNLFSRILRYFCLMYLTRTYFLRYIFPKTRRKCFLCGGILLCVFVFLLSGFSIFPTKTFSEGVFNAVTYDNININNYNSIADNNDIKKKKTASKETLSTTPPSLARPSPGELVKPVAFAKPFEVPIVQPAALIFTDYENKIQSSKLKTIFKSLKTNYDFVVWNRPEDNYLVFPRLRDSYGMSRYHVFIFTSEHIYDEMDIWSRNILRQHCLNFSLGMIIFTDVSHIRGETKFRTLSTLPVSIQSGVMSLKDFEIAKSSVLKLTKSGKKLEGIIKRKRHAVFWSNSASFETVAYAQKSSEETNIDKQVSSVIFDKGNFDGIQKVLFGTPIWYSWLHQLVFVDVMCTLSSGVIGYGLERLIQIDIDDVFVGKTGNKLIKSDIQEMIKAQDYFASEIPGFVFTLGYSSKFFENSNNSAEREGERYLVENASKFRWFGHTYAHKKPHTMTKDELVADFKKNKEFAQKFDIPIDPTYSVSPHHSGVYPTHEPLYNAWKEVWGVKVTSTEGYPHLYPAYNRKGFLHEEIMVLPRQTCGLFTKTLHLATYPKGPDWLYNSIFGGELFWTIVFNPVNIFMTHSGNYGFEDRLAITVFKNLTKFIKEWTNINLQSNKPIELAKKYFEIFPKHLEPLWTDPCIDLRHQRIWNLTEKYCKPVAPNSKVSRISRLPDFLIIGPQKSGTTALYTFLSLNHNLLRSRRSNNSFEEIQFFSRNNYMKGINWYLDYFPDGPRKDHILYFDKSANYFDSLKSPLRAYHLIPNAPLIVISNDPKMRAHSWYQHMKSKSDPITLNHTFYEVISGQNKTYSLRFDKLRKRCLLPGLFAEALERWLQYYNSSQIHIMDGAELRYKPHVALRNLEKFLNIPHFQYSKRVKYNKEKGFFCAMSSGGSYRCLGKSKGRKYAAMSEESVQYLTDFYRIPNRRFADLLNKMHKPLPVWLQLEVKDRKLL